MLLKEVQGEDVTKLDYDSALDKVIKSGRPLVLSFFLPANIKVTFVDDVDDFGMTFGGNSATDVVIKTIEDDSEGGDLPGLRVGLLLTHIDGAPVRDLAADCASGAEGHEFVVAKYAAWLRKSGKLPVPK